MPNIKPKSDFRNYYDVFSEVHDNEPVYVTKNGRGMYVVSTIEEYEEYQRLKAAMWLKSELERTERKNEREGLLSEDELKERLNVR